MAEQRNRTLGEGSPTGAYPSVADAARPHEPAAPRSLPEMPEVAGATGMFRIVAEGEDLARQQDDSASASGPDAEARSAGSA